MNNNFIEVNRKSDGGGVILNKASITAIVANVLNSEHCSKVYTKDRVFDVMQDYDFFTKELGLTIKKGDKK